MTLDQIQEIVDDWVNTHGVRYFSELTNTAILNEEVGEVSRLMARIYGDQSFKNPDDADHAHFWLEEELADVLFVLVCIANQTGISLTDAFNKTLEKKTKRDALRHKQNPKL
ncbi:MAG TPA: nucleotide pyrophosphohydrolase [Saprospiraceae bacterium]|nr:nucleotide pyrophosphohydrolase [Saprospiraceae bacterium]